MGELTLGVVQAAFGEDVESNRRVVADLVREAAAKGRPGDMFARIVRWPLFLQDPRRGLVCCCCTLAGTPKRRGVF